MNMATGSFQAVEGEDMQLQTDWIVVTWFSELDHGMMLIIQLT